MADFKYLEALDVPVDKTVEYTFHQITVNGRSPTLIVAPATEANKPYFNALLKRASKSARQVRAGAINAGLIEENREEDRELYPKYVARGWRDMIDGGGIELKFSVSDCADFLNALANWMFDDLRNFCGNPANYAESLDVEIKAKNSRGDSSQS